MQIRKRSGPRIDPWGTPAKTGLQDEVFRLILPVGICLINNFQESYKTLLRCPLTLVYKKKQSSGCVL